MATFLRTRAIVSAPAEGGDSLITYYWDSTGGTPVQVMTEAQARVRAFWENWKPQLPVTSSVIYNPVGDEVDEATGQIVGQFSAAGVAVTNGTSAGERLPYMTQGLLRFSTASFIGGRRLQGRQNIPLPAETDNGSGVPNPAYRAALQTAANILGTTIVTGISQRVWHRPDPLTGIGGLSAPVTARTVGTQWAVLRSRRA
jgi:hypothetical protein